MEAAKSRLRSAISYISTTAAEGVTNGPAEDAPDNVQEVDDYLLRVLEEPDPELEWESELCGALNFAYKVLPASADRVRMLTRAVYRELRRQGLLRHQQKGAAINGATKTSRGLASTGSERRRTCQDDDFDPFSP